MGSTTRVNDGFDGAMGRVAGAVMARLNGDMERAAVEELDPDPDDSVLAVGFGPGVGLARLAERMQCGRIAGIDPSQTMVEQAIHRNRTVVNEGRVDIRKAGAEAVPWPADSFDGVLAVNSIQLWQPLGIGLSEIARVLRPGGIFVAVTHEWAIRKTSPVAEWIATTSTLLEKRGLGRISVRTGRFRSGLGLVLRSELLRSCNPPAPETARSAG